MIPRNEYPRPQLYRRSWMNLNGEWQFEFDNAKCGLSKEYYKRESLDDKIIVPFCPESKLSQVGHTDFIYCVWYRRDIDIPEEHKGKNVILHFGAVDYHARLYVNGSYVGEHKGGYTSFSFDITKFIKDDGNYVTLCAEDDTRSNDQPSGKQSDRLESYGCFYTRTTGIWQTVWLEFTNDAYIDNLRYTTDVGSQSVNIAATVVGDYIGCTLKADVSFEGKHMGSAQTTLAGNSASLNITLAEKHLWEVGHGNLYDVSVVLEKDENVCDEVTSYFGLRSVCVDGHAFKLNGKTVFGRWVLDQGFYPDGIYTAPTDEALKNDIVSSMKLGFNGARLHEKVFEPRFLYWADKLGYLVWGEHANWGLDITEYEQIGHFLPEWVEAVERDINHPSIIGWCPFNETWDSDGRKQNDEVVRTVYRVTKALDPTRPVVDVSGNYHVEYQIYDIHNYEQNIEVFAEDFSRTAEGIVRDTISKNQALCHRQHYDGESPIFVSEYGGIGYSLSSDAWSYGNAAKSEEEYISRYKGLTDILLDNPDIMGFCYTQLYDVEQEMNGLMTYEREFKVDPEIIYNINSRKAAIED